MTIETVTFCPCCGHNLAAEQPIAIGALAHDPRGVSSWAGMPLRLTAAEHLLFGSIVAAKGRLTRHETIAERIGHDGDGNCVAVLLSRVRAKLRHAGAPAGLVETVRGAGVRLAVELA